MTSCVEDMITTISSMKSLQLWCTDVLQVVMWFVHLARQSTKQSVSQTVNQSIHISHFPFAFSDRFSVRRTV